jgi:hypothetical protein
MDSIVTDVSRIKKATVAGTCAPLAATPSGSTLPCKIKLRTSCDRPRVET